MKKDLTIKTILLYLLCFTALLFSINKLFFPTLFEAQNFLYWDAAHYDWIRNFGYKDFRVAFFPLFPMLWKMSSLGVYGIVLLNSVVFLLAFYFLIKAIGASPLETILYLSIPSFCFFLLPYSEAVFFASSTMLIIGLKNKRTALILLGLFLSTLARPAFTIFIPAIIIAELLSETINKKMLYRIALYLLTTLVGLLLVGIIQHHYTGIWFNFFAVQQGWGNKLQVPVLPFTSWAGGLIVRLDGAAMLVGVVAGIIMCTYIFKAKYIRQLIIPKEVIFSLCYIAGITLSVVLFRGGSLFSLNRFVFAVPFIIVAANFYMNQTIAFSIRQLIIGFVLIFTFWLLFGSYVHIQTLLKYLLLSVYLLLLVATKAKNKAVSKVSLLLFITINIVFQLTFFIRFLTGEWVG